MFTNKGYVISMEKDLMSVSHPLSKVVLTATKDLASKLVMLNQFTLALKPPVCWQNITVERTQTRSGRYTCAWSTSASKTFAINSNSQSLNSCRRALRALWENRIANPGSQMALKEPLVMVKAFTQTFADRFLVLHHLAVCTCSTSSTTTQDSPSFF